MVIQEDSYKHRGMRKKLVKLLESKGITNHKVLQAIGKVPRHYFFDNVFIHTESTRKLYLKYLKAFF